MHMLLTNRYKHLIAGNQHQRGIADFCGVCSGGQLHRPDWSDRMR